MKGPYERLKYDLARVWECPVCNHHERSNGATTFFFCKCQQKQEPTQRRPMRLIEEGARRIERPVSSTAASLQPAEMATENSGTAQSDMAPPDAPPRPVEERATQPEATDQPETSDQPETHATDSEQQKEPSTPSTAEQPDSGNPTADGGAESKSSEPSEANKPSAGRRPRKKSVRRRRKGVAGQKKPPTSDDGGQPGS